MLVVNSQQKQPRKAHFRQNPPRERPKVNDEIALCGLYVNNPILVERDQMTAERLCQHCAKKEG